MTNLGATRYESLFLRLAALILIVTAIAKIWSVFGDARILTNRDPLFGMEFRYVMLLAAFAELSVAGICLLNKSHLFSTIALAWLATNFLIYRFGFLLIHWKHPCPCLGNLTDALHVPAPLADTLMKLILLFLLIGSYTILLSRFRKAELQDQPS